MNHEIVTERWRCPVCDGRLRLFFSPGPPDGDGHSDDVDFDGARCMAGHELPAEFTEAIREDDAFEEMARAFERGFHVAEVWWAPDAGSGAGDVQAGEDQGGAANS